MPYTWEIFGDFDANFHDCFRMFNPIGAAQVQVSGPPGREGLHAFARRHMHMHSSSQPALAKPPGVCVGAGRLRIPKWAASATAP